MASQVRSIDHRNLSGFSGSSGRCAGVKQTPGETPSHTDLTGWTFFGWQIRAWLNWILRLADMSCSKWKSLGEALLVFGSAYQGAILLHVSEHIYICFGPGFQHVHGKPTKQCRVVNKIKRVQTSHCKESRTLTTEMGDNCSGLCHGSKTSRHIVKTIRGVPILGNPTLESKVESPIIEISVGQNLSDSSQTAWLPQMAGFSSWFSFETRPKRRTTSLVPIPSPRMARCQALWPRVGQGLRGGFDRSVLILWAGGDVAPGPRGNSLNPGEA